MANLLSNMTEVKYPYNYIFAGKASFNISDGKDSCDYEVSICNDDNNLYFVRIKNDATNKYDYAGCFRVSKDGEIKYFQGSKGKYSVNDDEIANLLSCINVASGSLTVNRTKITNCVCCGKEISNNSLQLMKVGVCSKCFGIYQAKQLKLNPNWSLPAEGLKISDISQVIHPNNIDYTKSNNDSNKILVTSKNIKSGYTAKDLEVMSASEDNINKTWGVYLDDNGNITQHVYIKSKNDASIPPSNNEVNNNVTISTDGFMDIPVGATDAEILEKLFEC